MAAERVPEPLIKGGVTVLSCEEIQAMCTVDGATN